VNLGEALAEQLKQALKQGLKDRVRALRMLKAELEVAETSGTEFKEVDVVKSYARKLRESLEEYQRLGVPDRASLMEAELRVVEEFLPRQMTRQEVESVVAALIVEGGYGPGDFGKVMKAVMSRHGDAVEGRLVQEVVRLQLAGRA
jgi:hypothetical protein